MLTQDEDLMFETKNFQGNVDLFVSALSQASSLGSSSVKLVSQWQNPEHNIILRATDRQYWNALTGNYFLCGLAYSPTSATMQAFEKSYQQTF